LLPLITTFCPLPSMVVLAAIVIVLVRVMMPLQLKVTVPPPDSADFKLFSSHTLTTPPACAGSGGTVSANKTRIAARYLGRMVFLSFLLLDYTA
jgi:hypothetical protein